MVMFENAVNKSKEFFPQLTIKYKDQSSFMKFLATLLFFNKDFMNYDTTIGNTIYLSSESFTKNHPVSATMILLHELVHIYDEQKYSNIIFSILYLLPQILALFFIPFIFIIGWKLSLFFLVFSLPIPAYFRSIFERRAYTISYYVSHKLNVLKNFKIDLPKQKDFYIQQFKSSSYYFMWPFSQIDNYFDNISNEINNGNKPECEPEVYDFIDKILINS